MMQNIQDAHNLSTYFLKEHDYNGRSFKDEIHIITNKNKTTVPETYDRIELLAAGTSH